MTAVSTRSAALPPVTPWEFLTAGRHFLSSVESQRWSAVFARVSTNDQAKDGSSLSQQIDGAIHMAQRSGAPLNVLYIDPGKSATKLGFDRRAGVRMLLEDVRAGKVASIYVYKRDRVARQSGEWLHFLKTCNRHQTKIIFTCPQEPPVGKGIYGKVQEAFMSLWAELEAEQISIRVRDSMINRFEKGEWIGSTPPFGIVRGAAGNLMVHPDEGPIVQIIFRLAGIEKWGPTQIARYLNESHPLSRRGFDWTRQSVQAVLQNRIYCGYSTLTTVQEDDDRRETVVLQRRSDRIPVLVSEEDWAKTEWLQKQRVHRPGATPKAAANSPNPFAGLLFCGSCGRPLSVTNRIRRSPSAADSDSTELEQAYYCRFARSGGNCSFRGSIKRKELERTIIGLLLSGMPVPTAEEAGAARKAFFLARSQSLRSSFASVTKEIAATRSAVSRNSILLERVASPNELLFHRQRIQELLSRLEQLKQKQAEIRDQMSPALSSQDLSEGELCPDLDEFHRRVLAAPGDLWRNLLLEAIDRIVVHSPAKRIDVEFGCLLPTSGG
jgi:DNA invertase Pin-like site-specific DNA recombinase